MANISDDARLLLQCPITKRRLVAASAEFVEQANDRIRRNQLTNRLAETADSFLDAGLIDEAGEWLYAVRNGIVCLLADEAFSLDQFEIEGDEISV